MPFTELNTQSLIKDGILFDNAEIKQKNKNKKEKLKLSRLRTKQYLTSKSVSTEHFPEIDFLNSENSHTIFQNNLNSLTKNLHLIDEIFLDCDKKTIFWVLVKGDLSLIHI